jgi:site-specific DNA recombinase
LERHNVTLEAVTESLESTELGKLINYIRGFASKLEAEKIHERTTRGKLARVKEGKLPQGTGIGIYGYNWDKSMGRRTILNQEADIVRRIYSDVIEGHSFNRIASDLNKSSIKTKSGSVWHPITVRRIAKNPTYTGLTYYGQTKRISATKVTTVPKEEWKLLPNITPPIITKEIYDTAQNAILHAKEKRPIKPNASYLFTGFAKCPKCGSPLGGTMLQGKYRYYQCRGSKPTFTRGKICDSGYIKADLLERSVFNKLLDLVSSPMAILKSQMPYKESDQDIYLGQISNQIDSLRKKLKSYKQKERNLYDLLVHDTVTKEYVLESVDKLNKERSEDEQQLSSLILSRKEVNHSKQLTVSISEASGREYSKLSSEFAPETNLYNLSKETQEELLEKKRAYLSTLNFKLIADKTGYRFSFILNGNVITTDDSKEFSAYEDSLSSMKNEPSVTINSDDDYRRQYIEKLKLKALNESLVTTERTSASLHARSCPTPPAVSPPD